MKTNSATNRDDLVITSVRLTRTHYEDLKSLAGREHRSVSAQLRVILDAYFKSLDEERQAA